MKKKKRPNNETETTPSKRVKKKDPDPEPKSQGGGEGCAAADGISGRCLNRMLFFNKNVVLEESLIKRGLELIGQPKRRELEEKWKTVELAELQTYVTRAELISDQASLILEAYKGH